MDIHVDTRVDDGYKSASYTTLENDYRIHLPINTLCKSCRVTYFLLSLAFLFLTLTKVDWFKNGLKAHEIEVPCCENLLRPQIPPPPLAARPAVSSLLFLFSFLFHRSNPALARSTDFCEMDNINVYMKYPTHTRETLE